MNIFYSILDLLMIKTLWDDYFQFRMFDAVSLELGLEKAYFLTLFTVRKVFKSLVIAFT